MDPGFLRLPTEIRLQIYHYLLLPQTPTDLQPALHKMQHSDRDSFDYVSGRRFSDRIVAHPDLVNPHLLIRTVKGESYSARYTGKPGGERHLRTSYDEKDRFRAKCAMTTYYCLNNDFLLAHVGIMRVNRLVHSEAVGVLYGAYTFDFDVHVEAMRPFLEDLTPLARSCIRSVRFVKRGLAYDKEYDRIEWGNTMRFLTLPSAGLRIKRLELGVVAGKPGGASGTGWDGVLTYSADDFEALLSGDGMEWLRDLVELAKTLEELTVVPVVEHCPPADNSRAMFNFVRFSASVDAGFAEFLQRRVMGA
ncbi:hypothetical protein BDY17DRAFT_289596 [Neohortaea acidophila]|uniref:F-box domain-containing protein n=1 Tax=Neohortaea acidophila TaxID=245834 RepID=A0A6A6Q6N9_9PEZI|nr:uncharacterized protein BDY17DRAFT_289596 [Neohortaea acidophila]KAF2487741.1 hypothetical protein BDY17DRAFT_289596 [Neohortaea acidophila]